MWVKIKMTLKCIIFDVDGTLTDTNQIHVDNWVYAFENNDIKVNKKDIKLEIGKGGDNLIPDILGHKPDKELEEKLNNDKAKDFKKSDKENKFKVFAKSKEIMFLLKEKGIKTAIATSATKEDFKTICDNISIDFKNIVDVLVTAEDVEDSKPDPDIMHATLKKLELKSNECLMVGDTPYDIEAAKKAGIKAIGVLTGFHDINTLKIAGAIEIYKDIKDIYENLDNIIKN